MSGGFSSQIGLYLGVFDYITLFVPSILLLLQLVLLTYLSRENPYPRKDGLLLNVMNAFV
jgi:hypothetical protein